MCYTQSMFMGFSVGPGQTMVVDRYYGFRYDGFRMRRHAHTSAEIMLAESGEADVFAGCEERRVRLEAGSFIVLDSMVPHRLAVRENAHCKILNLELRPAPVRGAAVDYGVLLREKPELAVSSPGGWRAGVDEAGVAALMREIHSELTLGDALSQVSAGARLAALFVAIARCAVDKEDSCVRAALEVIARRFAAGITPSQVAAEVGLHPVYLERQVKKSTGKTLLAHINDRRVDRAVGLMENTSLPLTDIAFESGFNTRQNFYLTFKKLKNLSPRAFRARLETQIDRYDRAPFETE